MIATLQKGAPRGLKVTKVNLPFKLEAVKRLGTAKMPGAINSTASSILSISPSKPRTVGGALNEQLGGLQSKGTHALNATVLEMATGSNQTPIDDPNVVTQMRSQLINNLIDVLIPAYSTLAKRNPAGTQAKAKDELLKYVVGSTGELGTVSDGILSTKETIVSNNKKDATGVAPHALEAIGGIDEYANSLDNPHEFAYANMNSTLQQVGLGFKTNDNIALDGGRNDKLEEAQAMELNILDPTAFKVFLSGSGRTKFSPTSGALSELAKRHPDERSNSSASIHSFNYTGTTVSNAKVHLSPKNLQSIMNGKIIGMERLELSFSINGLVSVHKKTMGYMFPEVHEQQTNDSVSGVTRGIIRL